MAAAGLALPCLGAAGWGLLHSGPFSARVVTVVGAEHTSRAAVVEAAGLAGHPPLIDVDPGRAAAAVARLPWVLRAEVARHWPDGVQVTVVERTPRLVVARPAGGFAEVDVTGRVLATVASPPPGLIELHVPVVPGAPGRALGAGAGPALAVAATLPRAFAAQVSAIEAGAGGQVDLQLAVPATVRLGSTSQLSVKYEAVAALLARGLVHPGDTVDVSVPAAPAVSGP